MSDTKISALTAAASALGAHEYAVNESGTSKKVTGSQLRTFARGPTAPTFQNVGTLFHSTGVPTANIGTTATDDIVVLVLQTSNDSQVTAPAGYVQIGPQNGIGAAATAGSVKLCVFWKRASGVESAPTIPDTGDHTAGVIFIIRGCRNTGRAFFLGGANWKFTTSTSATGPNSASWVDNCLIVDIFAHAIDATGGQASAAANTDLTSVTEQFDDSTTDGTGGGIVLVSGLAATGGQAIKATTLTWAATSVDVSLRLQFLPADADYAVHGAFPNEVWQYIGSPADLDDNFLKPAAAKRIFAQVCDGGSSGGGGRSAATAAGGGGGGGGGYDEEWFNADDLTLTTTVHAGKGGAQAAADAAGNAGVLSEFDKGGQGPLTSARRIAGTVPTAPASANGGDGGCGSGRGRVSPAVSTARIDLTAATAGAALGAVGGRGGSGAGAIGGSPADWGGGGGESGGAVEAAITSANNGWSLHGGGGGAGGRTNGNISGSGMGGGAAGVNSAQGAAGNDSSRLPYGGSGGCAGGTGTAAGGVGGFPGGGGGGGGGVASGTGGRGGHGMVQVTVFF